MSKEMERVFRELQQYLDQFGELSESETEEKVKEFMTQYNQNLKEGLPQEKDQWYYLDLAFDAENEKVARKNAQKALSIDPYCTDAEMLLIDLMDITAEEAKKRYEKLIEKTEAHLREEGYFDEGIGMFYGIVETRPYIRLLWEYLSFLIELGKYTLAVTQAKKMLQLNENDNMGARDRLMALYAFLEDVDGAEALYQAYPEESTVMLFPLVLLYYKIDDYTKARRYLKILDRKNPDLKKFLLDQLSDEYIDEQMTMGGYRPNTVGEIIYFMKNEEYLLSSSGGALLWIQRELKKKKK